MDLKEFRLSLLMLGWVAKTDNKYIFLWGKGEETLQWDKENDNDALFEQLVHHEAGTDASRFMLRGSSISHAYTSFAECIQKISDD